MSLAHVLLTSLIEKPSNGIELARRLTALWGFSGNKVINKFIAN